MDKKIGVQTTIEAKVIRADGRVEDIGKIHDSRWWWKFGPKQLAARRIKQANRSAHGNEDRK